MSALWGLANCWIRQGQLAWAPVSGSNILLSFVAKLEILWTGGLVAMFSWISQYWVLWGWTNISTLSPGHDERIVFWFSHKSKYVFHIYQEKTKLNVRITLLIYFTTETLCLGHWKRQLRSLLNLWLRVGIFNFPTSNYQIQPWQWQLITARQGVKNLDAQKWIKERQKFSWLPQSQNCFNAIVSIWSVSFCNKVDFENTLIQ